MWMFWFFVGLMIFGVVWGAKEEEARQADWERQIDREIWEDRNRNL